MIVLASNHTKAMIFYGWFSSTFFIIYLVCNPQFTRSNVSPQGS